jgi:hypothetical protein
VHDILFVVANSELKVARHDTLLLVVTRGVARKLKDLGRKVLEHSGKVY